MTEPLLSPEAHKAAHAAKNAQQAVEIAREAQIAEMVAKTAEETKRAVFEGLQQIFRPADKNDPGQMTIIHQKIPVICADVATIKSDIAELKDDSKWNKRAIIGGAIALGFAAITKIL
jgi:hypothetical protein